MCHNSSVIIFTILQGFSCFKNKTRLSQNQDDILLSDPLETLSSGKKHLHLPLLYNCIVSMIVTWVSRLNYHFSCCSVPNSPPFIKQAVLPSSALKCHDVVNKTTPGWIWVWNLMDPSVYLLSMVPYDSALINVTLRNTLKLVNVGFLSVCIFIWFFRRSFSISHLKSALFSIGIQWNLQIVMRILISS